MRLLRRERERASLRWQQFETLMAGGAAMPEPGFDYQSWMLAEVVALRKAVADKVSTQRL